MNAPEDELNGGMLGILGILGQFCCEFGCWWKFGGVGGNCGHI